MRFCRCLLSVVAVWTVAIALWMAPLAIAPVLAAPAPVATLPGLGTTFAGDVPELGLKAGHLLPCPASPNCVVSQDADTDHAIAPISYTGDRAAARELLVKVLGVVPRTAIVAQTDDYIRTQSTSRLMGFVDDAEFYLPADEAVIHLRSAARLGESDLGVNRRRLEQIRFALQDLGV